MRPIRPLPLVALLALGLGTLALGWREGRRHERPDAGRPPAHVVARDSRALIEEAIRDRKSTRLNSSHGYISYAVFCLKKKTAYFLAHALKRRSDAPYTS